MKTIKSSLFLAMATIFASSFFTGCYTQLACLSDEPDSVIDSPIIIVINDPPPPCIDCWGPPPSPPPVVPLPPAGSSPVVTETPSTPHRETGYQRSAPSQNEQTNNSGSHTSGSTRSGR